MHLSHRERKLESKSLRKHYENYAWHVPSQYVCQVCRAGPYSGRVWLSHCRCMILI